VSESWLWKATKYSDISIPIYNIFRQDRTAKLYHTFQVHAQRVRASNFTSYYIQK
jgi:hypothetical protein